jgi:ketosteroid isomerase-like protein
MAENVKVVRRIIDAVNRGDIEAIADAARDDFELDFSNSRGPMSGTYRGADGIREFMTSFFEPWAEAEFDPGEIVELDDERLLTVNTVRARGDESGAEVAATGASIWTIRDGKVAAVKLYQSKDEALEAG